MQSEQKVKTGWCKLGNNGLWLALSDQMIATLGIELETLLKMDFEVSIIEGRLRIEAAVREK